METWFNSSSSPPRPSKPKGSSGRNMAPPTPSIHTTAALQPSLTTPTSSALRQNPRLAKQQSHSISPTSNSASASTSTVSTSGTPNKTGSSSTNKNRHGLDTYVIRNGRRYIAD